MPEVIPTRPGPAAARFRPEPASGRVFAAERPVRSTDVTPAGRFRLDALARYLQDVAEDDVADTGWQAPYGWLLRRMSVATGGYPRFGQWLRLRTFCTATGPRWAERTTTVAGPGGDLMQAAALWVAADRETGRPVPLGEEFHRIYGEATQGRQVSSRLSLPGPETVLPGPAEAAEPGTEGPGTEGPADGGTGRCGPPTSTRPGTSTTPCTGPPWRTSWPGWTGTPPPPNWNTTGRSCPAAIPGW